MAADTVKGKIRDILKRTGLVAVIAAAYMLLLAGCAAGSDSGSAAAAAQAGTDGASGTSGTKAAEGIASAGTSGMSADCGSAAANAQAASGNKNADRTGDGITDDTTDSAGDTVSEKDMDKDERPGDDTGVTNRLMALVDSEDEARELAGLYDIEFLNYSYGVAVFSTVEDPEAVINRGVQNGWKLLERDEELELW